MKANTGAWIARFILFVGVLLIAQTASSQTDNRVPNPGFEQGDAPPGGWKWSVPDPNPHNIQWSVSNEAHTGSRSVQCINDAPAGEFAEGALWVEGVPVIPGRRHSFGFHTRAQNGTRIRSQIFWLESDGTYIQSGGVAQGLSDVIVEYTGNPLNHDWKRHQADGILVPEFVAGKQVAAVAIYLHGQGGGTYWFDDVFFYPQKEPLFPDLSPDSQLNHEDKFLMSRYYQPEGLAFLDVGIDEVLQMVSESRARETFVRQVPFREYYPLIPDATYHYRSDDFPNNIDYFDLVISGPYDLQGVNAFKVSTRNASDPEGNQSAMISAEGPLAFLQLMIDTEFSSGNLTVPVQTISLSEPLVIGVERLEEDFEQITQATASVLVRVAPSPVASPIPTTVRLYSKVVRFGDEVQLQDDAGTTVSKTLVIRYEMDLIFQIGSQQIPFFFKPGSGIFTFQRGIGLVQLQEFTDQRTPGEVFILRSAQLGATVFP